MSSQAEITDMPDHDAFMERNLALEVVRVTEAAALACSSQVGRGDKEAADQVAVDAMRSALNSLNIRGRVVIGEGERDEAPCSISAKKSAVGKARGLILHLTH